MYGIEKVNVEYSRHWTGFISRSSAPTMVNKPHEHACEEESIIGADAEWSRIGLMPDGLLWRRTKSILACLPSQVLECWIVGLKVLITAIAIWVTSKIPVNHVLKSFSISIIMVNTTYLITDANRGQSSSPCFTSYHVLTTRCTVGIGPGILSTILGRPDSICIAAVRDPSTSTAALSSLSTAPGSKLIIVKIDSCVVTDTKDAVEELQDKHKIKQVDVVSDEQGPGFPTHNTDWMSEMETDFPTGEAWGRNEW